jgi:hypothetical protein
MIAGLNIWSDQIGQPFLYRLIQIKAAEAHSEKLMPLDILGKEYVDMIKQEAPVELTISPNKIVFLIEKAKEFDADKSDWETEGGSDSVVPVEQSTDFESEHFGFINSLNVDEQIDLVALVWLGREKYTAADWQQLRAEAAAAHNNHTDRYLCGTPLLSDFLEAGLEALSYPVAELESDAF